MLVVSGVFSAATIGALAQVAVAYIGRVNARSVRLRSGEIEIEITGSTRLDDPAVAALLEQILRAGAGAGAGAGAAPRAVEGDGR